MPRKAKPKAARGKVPAPIRQASNVSKAHSFMPIDCSEFLKEDELPPQYLLLDPILPIVKNLDSGDAHYEFSTGKLFMMTELNNPIILYGHPFFGKSFVLKKSIKEIERWYSNIPNHWVQFINLKTAAKVLKSHPRPQSFIELCARCLNIPIKCMEKMFEPIPLHQVKKYMEEKQSYNLIDGELFLDGLDEMPPDERIIFLAFLSQLKRKREENPVRIWLTARSHLRAQVEPIFGLKSSFEIIGYDSESQMKLIHTYVHGQLFRNQDTSCHGQEVTAFTRQIYTDLSGEIKNFPCTIGSMPCMLMGIGQILIQPPQARIAGEYIPPDCIDRKSSKEVLDAVNLCFHENYKRKFGDVFPFHKMTELVRLILQYEYHFDCGVTTDFIDDELMSMGFLVTEDYSKAIRFQNRTLADYWLAKYFSIPGRPIHNFSEDSFFSILFFDKEAKDFRKFFDIFMQSVDRGPSPTMRRLLVNYYKLGKGMEEEWEKIKDEGSVLHLAIMEGFHRIAVYFLDAFSFESQTEMQELKKLLMIRAPVDVEQNRGQPTATKKRQLISTLSMIALFGYDQAIMCYFNIYKAAFEDEEIQREFETQNQWTPLHYAAAHSNLWFIQNLAYFDIIPTPGIFNPEGRLALHLLMTYHWNYSMILKDHVPDDDLSSASEGREGCGSVEEGKSVFLRPKDISAVNEMTKVLDGDFNMFRLVHHECFKHMLQFGEDFNVGTKPENMTVFQYAAVEGLTETKQFLQTLVSDEGDTDEKMSQRSPRRMNTPDHFVRRRQGASKDLGKWVTYHSTPPSSDDEDVRKDDSNEGDDDDYSDDEVEEVVDEDGNPVPDATRDVNKQFERMDLLHLKYDKYYDTTPESCSFDSEVPEIDDQTENGEEEEAEKLLSVARDDGERGNISPAISIHTIDNPSCSGKSVQ